MLAVCLDTVVAGLLPHRVVAAVAEVAAADHLPVRQRRVMPVASVLVLRVALVASRRRVAAMVVLAVRVLAVLAALAKCPAAAAVVVVAVVVLLVLAAQARSTSFGMQSLGRKVLLG
jgi:hypothetical protein